MGKKYLLEIEENKDGSFAWSNFAPYVKPDLEQVRKEAYEQGKMDAYVEDSKNITMLKKEAEEAYQRGLSDAWDAARKIWEYDTTTLKEIFGEGVMRMDWFMKSTASEVIEKIFAYEQAQKELEQEQEEIKVGDEVINQNKTAVVTEITDRYTRIMYSDGSGYALFAKGLTKTGRHFPEIAAVLQKMKES